MNDYEEINERDLYAGGGSSSKLLDQLARDVREIRKSLEAQGREINGINVSIGKLEMRQINVEAGLSALSATVTALQRDGRAETYVDGRSILQALVIALGLLAILGIVYWIGR